MIKRPLYRIISFESFISLCINKAERYVNPIDCWEDTFEGYVLKKLDEDRSRREVIDLLYNTFDKNISDTVLNLVKLHRARYSCYGQSWSTSKDSDAMWRIYSYNKHSIQVETKDEYIRKMIFQSGEEGLKVRVSFVDYDMENQIDNKLNQIVYKYSKVDEAFFHKRNAFTHEDEVRVIVQLTEHLKGYTMFSARHINSLCNKSNTSSDVDSIFEAVQRCFGEKNIGFYSAFPKEIGIPIKVLPDYIIGVRVHPQAEKWYVDLIEKICKKHKLNFYGKSDLYGDIV